MTNIFTEGGNFKTFLKENNTIAFALLWTDVTYLLKNETEHDFDGAYGVSIH